MHNKLQILHIFIFILSDKGIKNHDYSREQGKNKLV